MTTVHMSIIVYRASPLDYSHYRHTGVWLSFADDSPPMLVHVVGASREFKFAVKQVSKPWESSTFASLVDVGDLIGAATPRDILSALDGVPVRNDDPEFNCQQWVEGALAELRDVGRLSTDMYDKGLEGMVDAIAGATDVEG